LSDDLRELVRLSLAGRQEAMLALVERYRGRVFGLCYRMLGHRHDAEDVAQETFLRMLRSLSHWDPARDFEPWLLAIAANRCRTALAARKRRPSPQILAEQVSDKAGELQAARHLAEEVSLVLADLRDEYRHAFVLFHEHQLSYAEIAEALDCPVGTVKTWVHRARKELIERLRQRGAVHDPAATGRAPPNRAISDNAS
jgi:RNA polymerase sigma-70 factor (ECF subfamily)